MLRLYNPRIDLEASLLVSLVNGDSFHKHHAKLFDLV